MNICNRALRCALGSILFVSVWLPAPALAADNSPMACGLSFSTFFGGSGYERAQGVAVDKDGFIYIAGNTSSQDLPTTPGAFQRTYHGDNGNGSSGDGFVAKFSPDGSNLVWATYLGGSNGDRAYNVVVDAQGCPYVAVWTASADFPTTPGAFDTTHNSPGLMDLAYVKLKPDGSGLVYSTFVGGAGTEQARGSICVDSSGCLYSSGWTDSTNFPTTPGAYQRTRRGGTDAFLLKLAADGSQLLFSTLFGGSATEHGHTRVAVHSDGTIYFAGYTTSRDLPVSVDAFQKTYGGDGGAPWGNGDGFVAKFSSDASTLLFSTYLGGAGNDNVNGNSSLVIDPAGRVIVIGETHSTNFPVTANAFQTNYRGGNLPDGFVAILSEDGSRLLYATYLGGSAAEETSGLARDTAGNVYLSGNTASTNFPVTTNAYQKTYRGGAGNTDGFLSILSPDLSTLRYSTYLGGSGTAGGFGDRGRAVSLDPQGNAIVTGDSNSPDFPITPGAYQTAYRGGVDAFIARFTNALPARARLSLTSLTNGVFQVRLSGETGHTYRLEASTNFTLWLALTTNTVSNAPLDYIDTEAPIYSRRFYRSAE